jgi:two-component system, LuxR family, sensor kinase FixL
MRFVGSPRAFVRRLSGLRLSKTLIWTFSALIVVLTWATVIQQYRFEKERAVAAAVRQNVNRVIAFEQYVTRTLEAADVATLHIAERFAAAGLHRIRSPAPIADWALPAF